MVKVTAIHTTGDVDVVHTEAGHGGTVLWAQVVCSKNADGIANPNFLQIPCPTCGAVGTHPVTGGPVEDRDLVQQLFATKYKALSVLAGITTYAQGCTEVASRAAALGEGAICNVVGTTDPAPLVLANTLSL